MRLMTANITRIKGPMTRNLAARIVLVRGAVMVLQSRSIAGGAGLRSTIAMAFWNLWKLRLLPSPCGRPPFQRTPAALRPDNRRQKLCGGWRVAIQGKCQLGLEPEKRPYSSTLAKVGEGLPLDALNTYI